MQMLSKFLIALLAFGLAFSLVRMRTTSAQLASQSARLNSTSNQLASAETKLAELENAATTLRIQNKMLLDDAGQCTNCWNLTRSQVERLTAELGNAQAELRENETAAARASQELAQAIQQQQVDHTSLTALRNQLESLTREMAAREETTQQLSQVLNQSETEHAALRQQLSDPSLLKARILALNAPEPKPGNLASAIKHGTLALRPDGTVAILLAPKSSPPPGSPGL